MSRLALVVLLVGCGTSPKAPSTHELAPQAPRHCVDVRYGTTSGKDGHGRFCFSSAKDCRFARSQLLKYGSLGDIKEVGLCW